MAKSLLIIIAGCGRLGGTLANTLSNTGHSVVVIDQRQRAFDKLGVDFSGIRLLGDVTELGTLKEAQIDRADHVFAVTTRDSTNLMVAQIAQEMFKVPSVVARVYDSAREEVYREFGVRTVSPTRLSTQAFLDLVTGRGK
jgi:trk system potassium uptake protein